MSFVKKYLENHTTEEVNPSALAFLAGLESVQQTSPEVAEAILQELKDQQSHLKLIASENFSSLAVQQAMGNLLTDKYSEGYPFHRFYAGCDNVDFIENRGAELACELFGAEYAYLQPHSGADANIIAFWAILLKRVQVPFLEEKGKKTVNDLTEEEYEELRHRMHQQKMLGMSLNSGGHLTHGFRLNISSKMMRAFSYQVDPDSGLLDMDALRERVQEVQPDILLAGYSSYPRKINFAKMRELADEVGATLMVDMAHFSGLVAGGVFTGEYNPVPYADVITTTTHKTLRGPRGGLILAKKEWEEFISRGCPLVIGGPLPNCIAAKTVAFQEALQPEFAAYAQQVQKNASALSEALIRRGATPLTGGSDNHLLVIDVRSFGLTGKQAENALRAAQMTVNRNSIPFDPNGAWFTSGIRIGTPAATTLGMKEPEMEEIAEAIVKTLTHTKPVISEKTGKMSKADCETDENVLVWAKEQMTNLLRRFPLYPEIHL